MHSLWRFLTRRRSGEKTDWTDWVIYAYLILGLFLMLAPVLWMANSSFKSVGNLAEWPPTVLPMVSETVVVAGYEAPLPLYDVTTDTGTKRLAQVRKIGLKAQMIDPDNPEAAKISVNVTDITPVRYMQFGLGNYRTLIAESGQYLGRNLYNSIFITTVATIITLIMNSMAAFALSKYQFRGRNTALLAILATLMIPVTVVLVPVFLIISEMGLTNNSWGIILPVVATPTGVFLLRQYMLTIPDELLEAARMDHASEWRIYWRIILPLATPALAVVGIFSIISRWNEFLLPLLVLNKAEARTLQLALAGYQTETGIRYDQLLAMTALPLAIAFIFLQRYITTGIASTGIK